MSSPFTSYDLSNGTSPLENAVGSSQLPGLPNVNAQPSAPQQAPTPSRPGPIKQALSLYFKNLMDTFTGQPSEFEQQQIAFKNALTQKKVDAEAAENNARAASLNNRVPITLPNGMTLSLPSADATKLSQQLLKNQGLSERTVNELRGKLASNGLMVDQDENGGINFRQAKPEEMSPLVASQVELRNSETQYAKAKADLLTNPNNPTFQQNERKIKAQLAMAQQRVNIALNGQQRQDAQFQINNGVTPTGAPATIVGSGQVLDENGNAVGKNFQNLNTPTSQTRSAGQQAGAVAEHIPELRDQINKLAAAGKLGSVNGRINEWLNRGYGGDDPDIARFVSTLGLVNTGTMKAHVGARGGIQLLQQFNNKLNTSQEPKALQGSLDAFESFLTTYAKKGAVKTNSVGSKPSTAEDYLKKFHK
jgi:hypothetical protein